MPRRAHVISLRIVPSRVTSRKFLRQIFGIFACFQEIFARHLQILGFSRACARVHARVINISRVRYPHHVITISPLLKKIHGCDARAREENWGFWRYAPRFGRAPLPEWAEKARDLA